VKTLTEKIEDIKGKNPDVIIIKTGNKLGNYYSVRKNNKPFCYIRENRNGTYSLFSAPIQKLAVRVTDENTEKIFDEKLSYLKVVGR
jgi:hypothetical protein